MTVLTPEQIERGLTDENTDVRFAWAACLDYTPTPEQVERGLTDEDWEVRKVWIERLDYTPTKEQLARGLISDDENGRLRRFLPSFAPTSRHQAALNK